MLTLYRIVLSSTVDGVEALSSVGWTNDVREAMWFPEGDDANGVLAVEQEKADQETLVADKSTGEPYNGRYRVRLAIPSFPVYTLKEYLEREEEAARIDELCREQARNMGIDL